MKLVIDWCCDSKKFRVWEDRIGHHDLIMQCESLEIIGLAWLVDRHRRAINQHADMIDLLERRMREVEQGGVLPESEYE